MNKAAEIIAEQLALISGFEVERFYQDGEHIANALAAAGIGLYDKTTHVAVPREDAEELFGTMLEIIEDVGAAIGAEESSDG